MAHQHVVQNLENTSEIAAKHGLSNDELIEANPDKEFHIDRGVPVFDSLKEGEILIIP